MRYILAISLALVLPCFADDLVLKDGRHLAWKTLTDEGDTYSVETKDGKKLSLKKSEIERLSIGSQEEPGKPLTGASFTFNPKKVANIDLLPKAKTEATTGAWKAAPGVLVNTGMNPGRVVLNFDYELPEEYDLTIRLEREAHTGGFEVGIVSGEVAGCFHFDAFGAASSFFGQLGGQFCPKIDGQVFRPGKARIVRVSVRKDAALVQLDGKEIWKSRLDWKAVSLHGDIPKPEKGRPFVVAAGGGWKVHQFTLTCLK